MKINLSGNTTKTINILRIYCVSDNYIISSYGVSGFHYSLQGSCSRLRGLLEPPQLVAKAYEIWLPRRPPSGTKTTNPAIRIMANKIFSYSSADMRKTAKMNLRVSYLQEKWAGEGIRSTSKVK